jgi:predicted metal-dependent peptidase
MPRKRKAAKVDPAAEALDAGIKLVYKHPMFGALLRRGWIGYGREASELPAEAWAVVSKSGVIHLHPKRRAEPAEWAYVIAHCLLHLAFGHFREDVERPVEWQAACDAYVTRFLRDLKFGRPMHRIEAEALPSGSEEALYRQFCASGIPEDLRDLGVAAPGMPDMRLSTTQWTPRDPVDWPRALAAGLAAAVEEAVNVAAGIQAGLGSEERIMSAAQDARRWFIANYPILGALATGFKIIESAEVCRSLDIAIAAVSPEAGEIFMNPAAALSYEECRFVMAHELLHVGLCHQQRCQGRDHFLWNVACDYVINQWLVEMGVGTMPEVGCLYDPDLKGMSAEEVYDLIVQNLRRFRKCMTPRGFGLGDMLDPAHPTWWSVGRGCDLDAFYRRALSQGLEQWDREGRGFLPAGLVQEIRALSRPPISWDVELAQWFDDHFQPLEKMRTYARPSRRQSSTPDIPRPRYMPLQDSQMGRTFGVVLDTSGSMDRELLAAALGSIASYSVSREVPYARVVFCDAVAYDEGYMPPEAIADRVRVKGRGGTVLQPGINLLEEAKDFPETGPILIITDGKCDRLRCRRDHAFLIPDGANLPFIPRGPVFRLK